MRQGSLTIRASQVALVVKNLSASAGDIRNRGSIPGSGRPSGGGHGNPLQYSCLENPMDRGAWWASAHRVTESRAWLSDSAHTTIRAVGFGSQLRAGTPSPPPRRGQPSLSPFRPGGGGLAFARGHPQYLPTARLFSLLSLMTPQSSNSTLIL